jgi:hypothetical protein
MIEAAFAFDGARVKEILHGSDCSPEQRVIDAISLPVTELKRPCRES